MYTGRLTLALSRKDDRYNNESIGGCTVCETDYAHESEKSIPSHNPKPLAVPKSMN